MIVEVEAFTDAVAKLNGFGRTRTPQWFVEQYLSEKRRPGASDPPARIEIIRWSRNHRFDKLNHPSRWNDPESASPKIIEKNAAAIHCNWYSRRPGGPEVFEWERLIERHATVANGWTKDELLATKSFLNGKIMLIDGLLRVMPAIPNEIQVDMSVAAAQASLEKLESHIAAGRVPILKPETKTALLEKARKYKEINWGITRTPSKPDPQGSLFQ